MAYDEDGKYIPMSYRFERDMEPRGRWSPYGALGRMHGLAFDEDSNSDFYAMSEDEVLKGDVANEVEPLLIDFLNVFFDSQVPRMDRLYEYTSGENFTVIHDKRRADSNTDKSDKRVAHNWGGYISNFATSFMMSRPVSVMYNTGGEATARVKETDIIARINKLNRADRANYDLALDSSITGRAYELLWYTNDGGEPSYRFTRVDPREAFIIRSADLERKPLIGVYCPVYNGKVSVIVYTRSEVITLKPMDPIEITEFEITDRRKHNFGGVPIVEWRNSRDRRGDFENEISLIDAYDSAQSDSVNYMNDFNDALLVISNVDIDKVMGNDLSVKEMLDANMLILEGQAAGHAGEGSIAKPTADYIYKRYDVAGAEANKKRILEDLFQLTGIPDMDALNLNRQSTESYQNKYIGVKQLKFRKEQYYGEALKERYRLLAACLKATQQPSYDAELLSFRFHENMPTNVWGEIESYVRVGGEISQKTLRENTSFTTDEGERERIKEERQGDVPDEVYNSQLRFLEMSRRAEENQPVEEEEADASDPNVDGGGLQTPLQ